MTPLVVTFGRSSLGGSRSSVVTPSATVPTVTGRSLCVGAARRSGPPRGHPSRGAAEHGFTSSREAALAGCKGLFHRDRIDRLVAYRAPFRKNLSWSVRVTALVTLTTPTVSLSPSPRPAGAIARRQQCPTLGECCPHDRRIDLGFAD